MYLWLQRFQIKTSGQTSPSIAYNTTEDDEYVVWMDTDAGATNLLGQYKSDSAHTTEVTITSDLLLSTKPLALSSGQHSMICWLFG